MDLDANDCNISPDDPLGFDTLGLDWVVKKKGPAYPVTILDEWGLPEGLLRSDSWTGQPVWVPCPESNVGRPTRGWDDENRCWQECSVVWDGAAPEAVTHNAAGHGRGMLLPDYPSGGSVWADLQQERSWVVPHRVKLYLRGLDDGDSGIQD